MSSNLSPIRLETKEISIQTDLDFQTGDIDEPLVVI